MPLTIRDQYTNCATRLNIPNRTTTSSLPEHSQNPFQACPSTRRNRLSKNRKKNNSAAMLYPALECFCTVVGSSSSSSCFSQQKHRKPARYTALWPKNARNGSVWSKISNALKRLGFRSRNFLAQLVSETSRACTI